jgi:predicted transposase YdaD
MHTDTIFYQIFLTFHTLLFELLGQPTENAEGYEFTSVEAIVSSLFFSYRYGAGDFRLLCLTG